MLVKLLHPTRHNTETRKDRRKQAGCLKNDTGGLFTAGEEDARGRGVWEDSDQLHADLQRPQKKTSAWRERETDIDRNSE